MPEAPTRHGLPPELYREIFSLVHRKSDLCTLCRVSSIVRGVIEPILYHQVELHYGWMPPNTAACKYIAATPHIAKMVRSLSIPTGFGFGFNNMPNYALEALRKMLASLLRAVVNLRALYILEDPFGNTRWSYLQPEIFEGCTFCLSTFHNEPDRGAEKWDSFQLLSQQSNISDWVSASPEETTIVGKKGLLPLLSIVEICDWTSLAALISRPVQRLRLAGSPIAPLNQISNLLRPFGRTLTHLHFQTKGDDLEILREVASAAPHLKFLGCDGDDYSWVSRFRFSCTRSTKNVCHGICSTEEATSQPLSRSFRSSANSKLFGCA